MHDRCINQKDAYRENSQGGSNFLMDHEIESAIINLDHGKMGIRIQRHDNMGKDR